MLKDREGYTLLLLEKYRLFMGISAKEAFRRFEEAKIFDYINLTYGAIHTQDTKLVVREIVELITQRTQQ